MEETSEGRLLSRATRVQLCLRRRHESLTVVGNISFIPPILARREEPLVAPDARNWSGDLLDFI